MRSNPEPILSYGRRGYVIPNGCGMLWTDQVFSTEGEAFEYLKANWPGRENPPPDARPVLADVHLSAVIVQVPEASDAQHP